MELNKLTKAYKVVHIGTSMVMPLVKQPDSNECYPGVGTTAAEFDTYAEALKYVNEHGLIYQGPEV